MEFLRNVLAAKEVAEPIQGDVKVGNVDAWDGKNMELPTEDKDL